MITLQKRIFALAVAAAAAGLLWSAGLEVRASQEGVPDLSPPYRPYFYNYPHAIPPDYVFRTGRVFSRENLKSRPWSRMMAVFGKKPTESPELNPAKAAAFQKVIARLGSALVRNAQEELADEYVLTVSTFVNLNNLYATSSLGRYLGEQLIGELQKQGLAVIDVRKTPGIMISQRQGEFGLSRDMDELSFIHQAQAMLVGTYSVTESELLINTRILRNQDGMVLSTANLVLPMDSLVERLLADESQPAGRGSSVTLRAFSDEPTGLQYEQ